MSCPVNSEELYKLKIFFDECSKKPHLLNMPQLSFIKDFVEKLGGKVPRTPFDEADHG